MSSVPRRRRALLLAIAFVVWVPTVAAAAPEGTPCPAEPTEMTVGYGDLVTCAVDLPGDTDLFRFSGAAGDVVQIVVSGSGGSFFRACAVVFDPGGAVLGSAICANGVTTLTLPSSGIHTIEVSEHGLDQAIAYRLGLERLVPISPTAAPIPFGVTTSGSVDPAGDTDLFVFDGSAGDVVRLTVSGSVGSFFRACAQLYGPDGAPVGSALCANGAATLTLTAPGTHTIGVAEHGLDQAIDYTVLVQCLTGPTCALPSGAQPTAAVACHTTISYGAGAQRLKFCLSDRGNLVQLESPAGVEHLAAGAHGEGYAVCSAAGTHGYDVGYAGAGFGPPTIDQPKGPDTLPLTVVRTSLDGAVELRQTFARDVKEKDVTITMVVKNVSGATLSGVQLTRSFDGDIDASQGDDTYAHTVDSVWGWQVPAGNALKATAGTLTVQHGTGVETFWEWHPGAGGGAGAAVCGPGHAPGARGDYVGRLNYVVGNLAAGKSKTVKVIYQRF